MVIWCNARWTQRVWFLHSTSDGFKFDISRALQIRLFAPKELVPTGELNIVHRGEAMYNGKVLTRGQTWGEDIILSSVRLRKSNPSPNPNPNPTPTPNQVKLRKSNSARAIQFLEGSFDPCAARALDEALWMRSMPFPRRGKRLSL